MVGALDSAAADSGAREAAASELGVIVGAALSGAGPSEVRGGGGKDAGEGGASCMPVGVPHGDRPGAPARSSSPTGAAIGA